MTPTPSQTVGPFFGFALPFEQDAHAVPASAKGAIRIEGQLLDGAEIGRASCRERVLYTV